MLEAILKYSTEHRNLVVVLTLLVATCGAYSLTQLPIDAVPDVTSNLVMINTVYPSLSILEVEKQITHPVETTIAGIPGLIETRSKTLNGFSQVIAVFDDDVSIYFARQQVGERLREARDVLPTGAEPKMGPIATGLSEIYLWTVAFEHPDGAGAKPVNGQSGWQTDGSYLTPEGRNLRTPLERSAYLREVQDWIIRPQLKGVAGVAGVDAIGGYVKQYHVEPDPLKLVSYGLTFADVIAALERNNISTGAGFVEHNGEAYLVRASGRIESEQQIESIVVGTRAGTPIYIRDVASAGIGRELRTGSASANGREVVVGTAMMLIGANSRTVSRDVHAQMEQVNLTLPADIRAETVYNRTRLVDATIATVRNNLIEGAILVIVVLFLLLGNFKAALLTATAIPLSMLMTAIGMVQTKISGNLMSLGAIDFGLIVDGAVIIVENCLRMLAERQHSVGRTLTLGERLETVFLASKQVRSATAFGEAIIIIVYFPVLALSGVEGKMFKPMALTVIFALASAFILSLTFIPAMVAIVMRGKVSERENVLIRAAKRVYVPLLQKAIEHRAAVVGGALALFVAAIVLFTRLGQEFVPTLDEQDVATEGRRVPSVSLTQTTEMQLEVERAIRAFPEVAFVFSKNGTAELATDLMSPNASDTFIVFKPRDQWPNPRQTKAELVERLETALKDLPGNLYEFTQPIQMRLNELVAGVRSDVAVKVFGENTQQILKVAESIAKVLETVPGNADLKIEQTQGLPVIDLQLDRFVLGRYGLNMADVQDVIDAAIGGRSAGVVFEGDRRFELVVRLPERIRTDLNALENLPIPLPAGLNVDPLALPTPDIGSKPTVAAEAPSLGYVPLVSLLKEHDGERRIAVVEGPNQISRDNGKRRISVQCNVRGRDIGSFVAEAQRQIAAKVKLPPGMPLPEWGGQYENLVTAKNRLLLVVPLCFVLIFGMLYSTFHSFKYALLVFSGVPLALSGGVFALWLRGMPFSITAAVGFIALSGVAVLNGLVIVTFINQLHKQGDTLDDAIFHGAVTRLRPVLMTALVASLGFFPMALANGTGSEVQKPLATVVIGGIVSSTLLTLFVLPALYRLWHRADSPAAPTVPSA